MSSWPNSLSFLAQQLLGTLVGRFEKSHNGPHSLTLHGNLTWIKFVNCRQASWTRNKKFSVVAKCRTMRRLIKVVNSWRSLSSFKFVCFKGTFSK